MGRAREFDPDLPLNEDGVDVTEVRGTPVAVFSPDASPADVADPARRGSRAAVLAGAGLDDPGGRRPAELRSRLSWTALRRDPAGLGPGGSALERWVPGAFSG
ncbi:hypothetical protein A5N15_07915 [Rothia kristinae]|uniref:Uncharacterized protein n=1 Tax=Rothia kristinae TaxID=37923 RepID=A0A657IUE1_9MICC|nr:hypothetical protein A5N15_07915 [Rothia kristinae]